MATPPQEQQTLEEMLSEQIRYDEFEWELTEDKGEDYRRLAYRGIHTRTKKEITLGRTMAYEERYEPDSDYSRGRGRYLELKSTRYSLVIDGETAANGEEYSPLGNFFERFDDEHYDSLYAAACSRYWEEIRQQKEREQKIEEARQRKHIEQVKSKFEKLRTRQ